MLLPLLLWAACDSEQDERLDRLHASRSVWLDAALPDYEFTWQRMCFCPLLPPVRVLVDGNAIVRVADAETSAPLPADRHDDFPTIDALFDELEELIRRDPHRLEVTYDPELGYPSSVSVDIDERIADEEFSYTVTDLAAAADLQARP